MEIKEDPSILGQFDYSSNPSWRVFRIMAEFVEGFTFLNQFKKTVTFFGSARFKENSYHYREAQKLARMLAQEGFVIITGGGPGIMEAGNKGAVEGGGESVGLNIMLPNEQRINPYVRKSRAFSFFFTRKVMLSFAAQAYVFFPGGFGTLDEFFELITLLQTKKIELHIPVVLVGKDYWSTLTQWLHKEVLERHGAINDEDINIWHLVESVEEAFKIIKESKPRCINTSHFGETSCPLPSHSHPLHPPHSDS